MKSCRLQALKDELIHDWDQLNLSAKALVFIGVFLLSATVFIALYNSSTSDLSTKIDVIFRSCLASVFGFILSSNIKNNCKKENTFNDDLNQIKRETTITEECKTTVKENNYYSYREGNSIQIFIAVIVTLVCGILILLIYVFNISDDNSVLSQFRDLMCMSVGFLLGESKIKKDIKRD